MWKRDKKKLKKELSLNYTVMLLPHSKDKPIHFKIPVWVFMAAFLSLFTLFSLTLFFSYSSYRLRGAAEQKILLEAELKELEVEKARLNEEKDRLVGDNLEIAKENAELLESQKSQESQLENLKTLSDQVTKELEELSEREKGIRDKLGLEEEPNNDSVSALSAGGKTLSTGAAQGSTGALQGSTGAARGSVGESQVSTDESQVSAGNTQTSAGNTQTSAGETQISADQTQVSIGGTAGSGGQPAEFGQPNQVYDIMAFAMPGPVNLLWKDQTSLSAQTLEQELLVLKNNIRLRENSYDAMGSMVEQYAAQMQNSSIRQKIVNYAMQFVGNSYVYGGNDPHSGVDCSGFSRYILSNIAGVNLSRTSSSQSSQGTSVSIDNARQGDLIFYGSGNSVNHVAIYIGNGKVVHASNARTGIIVSDWNYRKPVAIKNVID